MSPDRIRVLIAGAGTFAYWNAGDEAILDGMLSDLRGIDPAVDICVVSNNPAGFLSKRGVRQVPSSDIARMTEAARESDLLLLGGGGIFYDYFGVNTQDLLSSQHAGLAFYCGFALLARILGKPLVIYGVGVGPLQSEIGQLLTRTAFEQAVAASVRDQGSRDLLASIGVDAKRVRVTADPGFQLEAAEDDRVTELLRGTGVTWESPVLAVCLRPWALGNDQPDWEGEVAEALDRFLDAHGGRAAFVPFHRPTTDDAHSGDDSVSVRVRDRMRNQRRALVVPNTATPAEKAAVIARADLVVGMRLHSIVFASKYGVPTVGLAYDPKVGNLLETAGLGEFSLELRSLDATRLLVLLEQAWSDRDELATKLKAAGETLVAAAGENADLVASVLREPPSAAGPRSQDVTDLLGHAVLQRSARIDELHASLVATHRVVDAHARQITEVESRLANVERGEKDRVAALEIQIANRDQAVQGLQGQLDDIVASRGWALLQLLWRTRLALVPRGSRAERMIVRAVRGSPTAAREPVDSTQEQETESVPTRAATLAAAVGQRVAAPEQARAPGRSRIGRPRVAILTNQLLDWFTREPRFGGGERYCMTLSSLLRELGFEVTIFQAAAQAFESDYYGLPVIALPGTASYSEFQYGLGDAFHERTGDYDYVIYNLPEYASGTMRPGALLICHGIWFDHNNYAPPIAFRTPEWFDHLYRSFSRPARVVSVDTNSINTIRVLWPELTDRMMYIPNWVDTDVFTPPPARADGQLTVVFPRRSQINRGSRILADILRDIDYQCRFWWVGEGDAEDTQIIKDLATRDPRLEYFAASFEEMPGYLRQADIAAIPTIACEGTSLAALEALASGAAVVATNVGGLPDLIQPDVNGLLVEPNAKAIAAAVSFLIENPEERARLQAAGPVTARHFSHAVWGRRWTRLLGDLGWLD
jgi:polysaccharide pyruvyl transferase CsaB